MTSIFTVHGMSSISFYDEKLDIRKRKKLLKESYRRTFGWYSKLKDAKRTVKINRGDLYECSYKYIVIEEFPEGVWSCGKKEWWYEWDGKKFCSIKKPDFIMNTINWGMC